MRRVGQARVVLAAAALALLPKVGHAEGTDNVVVATSPVVVTTNQSGIGVNICGSNCVQVVYVVNISIVNVNVGSGTLPKMSIDPVMMDFGSVRMGRPSPVHSVMVTNADKRPVTVADASLTGPQSTDFGLQSMTCIPKGAAAVVLAPGATCRMDLLFTPTGIGFRVAVLHFAVDQLIHWVPLLGVGTQAELGLSTTALDFGKVAVGRSSPPQDVSLRNVGSAPLSFMGISLGTDFAQSNDCLPSPSRAALQPGGTCAVRVTFTPTARSTSTGSLTLASDAAGGPRIVSLSGTGIKPAAQIVPSRLKFAAQPLNKPGPVQTLVLTNSGSDPLEVAGTQLSGANATSFTRTSDCPPSLAPAASCGIKVSLSPQQAGDLSAALMIQDNANDSPQSVPLSGVGQEVPSAAAPTTAPPGPATGGAAPPPVAPAAPVTTPAAASRPVATPTPAPAATAAAPAAPVAAAAPPPPVAAAPAPAAVPAAAAATCPAPASDPPSTPAQGIARPSQVGSLQPDEGRPGADEARVLSPAVAGSGLVAASSLSPTGSRLLRDENAGLLKSLPRAASRRTSQATPPWPRAFDWLLLCLLAGVATFWVTLFRTRRPWRDRDLLILDDGIESPAATQQANQVDSRYLV